mmetsp:Transcript_8120/g.33450  ORF Transcript_8120/g.33450 Transcript_8120/m.33450 type:complete len:383 (+) Transcript_8120:124-1272(+)
MMPSVRGLDVWRWLEQHAVGPRERAAVRRVELWLLRGAGLDVIPTRRHDRRDLWRLGRRRDSVAADEFARRRRRLRRGAPDELGRRDGDGRHGRARLARERVPLGQDGSEAREVRREVEDGQRGLAARLGRRPVDRAIGGALGGGVVPSGGVALGALSTGGGGGGIVGSDGPRGRGALGLLAPAAFVSDGEPRVGPPEDGVREVVPAQVLELDVELLGELGEARAAREAADVVAPELRPDVRQDDGLAVFEAPLVGLDRDEVRLLGGRRREVLGEEVHRLEREVAEPLDELAQTRRQVALEVLEQQARVVLRRSSSSFRGRGVTLAEEEALVLLAAVVPLRRRRSGGRRRCLRRSRLPLLGGRRAVCCLGPPMLIGSGGRVI